MTRRWHSKSQTRYAVLDSTQPVADDWSTLDGIASRRRHSLAQSTVMLLKACQQTRADVNHIDLSKKYIDLQVEKCVSVAFFFWPQIVIVIIVITITMLRSWTINGNCAMLSFCSSRNDIHASSCWSALACGCSDCRQAPT